MQHFTAFYGNITAFLQQFYGEALERARPAEPQPEEASAYAMTARALSEREGGREEGREG